jgi:hypothetical protein
LESFIILLKMAAVAVDSLEALGPMAEKLGPMASRLFRMGSKASKYSGTAEKLISAGKQSAAGGGGKIKTVTNFLSHPDVKNITDQLTQRLTPSAPSPQMADSSPATSSHTPTHTVALGQMGSKSLEHPIHHAVSSKKWWILTIVIVLVVLIIIVVATILIIVYVVKPKSSSDTEEEDQ